MTNLLNEKTFKFIFSIAIIIIGIYYTYPVSITDAQKGAYVDSYFTTLGLTFGGIFIGIVLGFILAFLKFLNIKILSFIIDEYIDIVRGTPVLLQLMIFAFVILATLSDNFYAAVIALGLNSSAYVAEIVRSGINSVDKGQMEAARAMGLSYSVSMRQIIFPQAVKNILPALANEFISLFKETSVVGLIGIFDLTMQSKSLQATLFSPEPILFAGVIYYANVKLFSLLAKLLENRLNKND
ncbi:His/Glu/Gln/Arg/opine amino acid ABC transporter permease [Campylobacter hyointestinalis]|uniref:Amino acid ABC transporter permease n=1 Tax=Campylobacter hyointestinalis subsp. hyointestinalis TaxID=91352 RepID=A0A855N1Q6_CAMHY|nr:MULTISPECIES: amino acid ABC transporter permease [Campylobacter]MPB71835.1 amino acid ABC transporter permease [Campylobacter fetus]MPB77227.1 amino acid ABC transporter permease [Campylobacter fetus]PPB51150.1 amino acid ABC transporter permease [Campylobacter hyointestinalis subsp. hyointestinalis]PPB51446.1 amino acid ABC transporter permease [Campylobacter hyointestinalis subsp. hyointestinalis]PPB56292.1 amino acid ABC transporter permease [Campylobacter hyointestinalis subsp. hyointe